MNFSCVSIRNASKMDRSDKVSWNCAHLKNEKSPFPPEFQNKGKSPLSGHFSRKEKRPIFRRSSAGSLRDPRTCPNAGKWAFLILALRTGIEPSEITLKSPVSKGTFLCGLNFVLNVKFGKNLLLQLLKHLTQNSKDRKKYELVLTFRQTNPIVIWFEVV